MMLNKSSLALVIQAAGYAAAHFSFGHLIVNGTESGLWQYVRDVGPELPNNPDPTQVLTSKNFPQYAEPTLKTTNITCGRNAFASAANTDTATVLAGSEIGFRIWEISGYIGHRGPIQVYLSRAPNDDVQTYQGDGDWFKIAYAGPVDDSEWESYHTDGFNFTIPETTPPGTYLMRIEHIYVQHTSDWVQFYVNCAHVNIIGPGGGTPTELAQFPGTYVKTDPGITVERDMWVLNPPVGLDKYQPPGPPVWTGA